MEKSLEQRVSDLENKLNQANKKILELEKRVPVQDLEYFKNQKDINDLIKFKHCVSDLLQSFLQ